MSIPGPLVRSKERYNIHVEPAPTPPTSPVSVDDGEELTLEQALELVVRERARAQSLLNKIKGAFKCAIL